MFKILGLCSFLSLESLPVGSFSKLMVMTGWNETFLLAALLF